MRECIKEAGEASILCQQKETEVFNAEMSVYVCICGACAGCGVTPPGEVWCWIPSRQPFVFGGRLAGCVCRVCRLCHVRCVCAVLLSACGSATTNTCMRLHGL